jgi:signal transduction histidine kinase/DNA-binding response OmpR family regulator
MFSRGECGTFTVREGASSNEFNRISHLKARDGTLYFGSINGVTAVHPRDFAGDFFPGGTGGLVLLSARAQGPDPGETVDLLPYYLKTGTIQIQPDERFIKLHFAAPSYNTAGTTSYYYKIEGVNDTWQQINSPDVMFPRLPGGHYRIFFRTGSKSGVSSAEPVMLEMEVLPYIYEEPWFFLLMLAVIAVLGIIAWRIRVKYLLDRQLELEGKVQEATSQILADKKLIEAQMDRISNISEEKNRFFVNITHELRTPLTLITAPLESIQHRRLLPEKESEMLSTALRNSRQLLVLINDLLLLSRDQQLKAPDIRQRIEIIPVIEDIVRLHSYSAAQKGIRFHFIKGVLEKPVVEADEKLFRRALENIVANAVKYSDGAGKITISVSGNNETVTVSVADTGRGIDAADMPHIFERYFQTQRADVPFEGGTGIGLSIAREIMELFGGNIRVESEVGKGSVFHLDFPAQESTSEAASHTWPALQPIRINTPLDALKRRKIYVVDDNPEIGKFLSDMLGDDFDVAVFFSGSSLLNNLKDNVVPDLLICDLMMPGMNGFELMEQIRSSVAYDSMKMLVLTAMTTPDAGERALSAGATAVLWKPFSLDEMKHRITELFSEVPSSDHTFTPLVHHLSEEQLEWLGQLNRFILLKMATADFSVEWLALNMHVSRSTLFRELNKLTGQTPNEYIQGIRLEYARRLLESGNAASVAEVLAAVGLKDKIHFSRIYRERFGKSPHTYIT